MSFGIDIDCPEWRVFEAVQPLFASVLPWRIRNLNGDNSPPSAAEAVEINTFTTCFSTDMTTALTLLPKHKLSEREYESFSGTLLELLDFLEGLVLESVTQETLHFSGTSQLVSN